jgi:cell wall-associated NlpC family hydrolase
MRNEVVKAARSWLGTPYHHMAKVKGIGVDCGQLVIAAFEEAGAIEAFDPGFYTSDWHLHRDEDRYVEALECHLVRRDTSEASIRERVAQNYATPDLGDVLAFRVGRTYSHGGIVTGWPYFIHSSLPAGIVEEIDVRNSYVCEQPCRVYTLKGFDE